MDDNLETEANLCPVQSLPSFNKPAIIPAEVRRLLAHFKIPFRRAELQACLIFSLFTMKRA